MGLGPEDLERGGAYLVKEQRRDTCYGLLRASIGLGIPSLLVTRQYPERVRQEQGLVDARIVWLSHAAGQDYLNPGSIGALEKVLHEFIENHSGEGLILLDGLEFLIMTNGFLQTLMFVERVSDFIMQHQAILLIPVGPEALQELELALLERTASVLEPGPPPYVLEARVVIIPIHESLLPMCQSLQAELEPTIALIDESPQTLEEKMANAALDKPSFVILVDSTSVREDAYRVLRPGRPEVSMRLAEIKDALESPTRVESEHMRRQNETRATPPNGGGNEEPAVPEPPIDHPWTAPTNAETSASVSSSMGAKRMKAKICLVGEAAVEKTTLIRRFVLDNLDDRHIKIVGSKVSKKELSVPNPRGGPDILVDLTIWDIMGQKAFRELLKEAFFYGAKGIIAVCDVARRQTLDDLLDWIDTVFEVNGRLPLAILVNETSKGGTPQVTEADVQRLAQDYEASFYFTSSATGANVEAAFRGLAQRIVDERFAG